MKSELLERGGASWRQKAASPESRDVVVEPHESEESRMESMNAAQVRGKLRRRRVASSESHVMVG